jgi:putative addiction module component (TIGR02574 family)
MSMTREALRAEVLNLPPEDRQWLIDLLVESLDEEFEIEPARLEELERRGEDLASGRISGIPREELFPRVRARLG